MLTPNADRGEDFVGTSGDDTFEAPMGTINFVSGNTLNTGDVLDGNGGNNTLIADLINDSFSQSGLGAVRPTTDNIQNVLINAIPTDGTLGTAGNNVTLNASRMQDVENVWSIDSDASLTVADITTKTSDGGVRNTEDLTFRMDHTSNFNTDPNLDASNLTVYFDENYLLAGRVEDAGRIQYEVMNQDAWDLINLEGRDDVELLDGVIFQRLDFELNGERFQLAPLLGEGDSTGDGLTIRTHEDLAAAINAALAELGLADTVTASVGPNFVERSTVDGAQGRDAPAVILEATAGNELTANENFAFLAPVDEPGEAIEGLRNSNRYDRADEFVLEGRDEVVTTNLELHKVGRGDEGGDAWIGGKAGGAIPIINVDVLGDDSKPSDVGSIFTPGMRDMNIATHADYVNGDSFASLTIRDGATSSPRELLDADDFLGNINLGTTAAFTNVDTVTATGGGNVLFNGAYTAAGDYSVTTGGGTDTINVFLNGAAVNDEGTGLAISTGAGADRVTVSMDLNDGGFSNAVSYATMEELENLSINTGAGNDHVNLDGYGTFHIDAGAGDDFVRINSADSNGNANLGFWNLGSPSASTVNNGVTFMDGGERVLYNAELTVSFAGFEATASVETDRAGNFLADQSTINAAIIEAIEGDRVLSQLLNVAEGTGSELFINSTIGGDNWLSIDVFQPELVTSDADDGQVVISSGDVSALRAGLIATTANNSDDLEDADDIAGVFNGEGYGSIDRLGDGDSNIDYNVAEREGNEYLSAPGGNNADVGVNFSSVNPGSGDDVVVFHSNTASSNTLVLDSQFGTVNVVNFHNQAPSQADSYNDVGIHALDFTAFLDNRISESGSTASEEALTLTLNRADGYDPFPAGASNADNTDQSARANSVNMLGFDSDADEDQTFQGLTANVLLNALNSDDADDNFGGITDSSLTAVAQADLVGTTQKHIVMVENDLNPGEYKVFYLQSALDGDGNIANDGEFTNAQLLGTLDFGASVNFALVGNEDYESLREALINHVDQAPGTPFVFNEAGNKYDGFTTEPGAMPPNGDDDVVPLTLAQALDLGVGSLPNLYTIDPAAGVDAGAVSVADALEAFASVSDIISGAQNAGDLDAAELFAWSVNDSAENILESIEEPAVTGAGAVTLTDEEITQEQADALGELANFELGDT
ncbi:hypothetical protein LRB11_16415, partial [Ectothiorhodospira haloalkaliphila]|uniref:hypothetical protein n=1 Tax=Ectothiorhodospira haloalkaliphila TaxID=421628 RepID=UPI001EE92E5E